MTPENAEEYTQALGQVMAGSWRQIALGRRLGVPQALGLTVQQWVDDRLGGYVKLSLQERSEAVRMLKDEGLSNRAVAAVLGVDEGTVRNAQKPAETSAAEPASAPAPMDAGAEVSAPEPAGSADEEPEPEHAEHAYALPPEPPRKEPKSHATAHDERMEASRREQEATTLVLPDLAGLGLDHIEYGTNALAYLAGQEAGSARMCITSPPYWKKRTYTPGEPLELGQEPTPELYVDGLCAILNAVGRVLKEDGCLFLNLGDTLASQPGQYRGDPARRRGISDQAVRANGTAGAARDFDVADKSYVLIPERVVVALTLDYGWRLAGKIVWHKLGHGPENVYDRLTQAWEPIYVLTRAQHCFFERQPGRDDWWAIPVGRGGGANGHLAPFPEALVERALKHASEPGDVVLDPFAGSGTVLEVARRMGRRFLGCDLHPLASPLAPALVAADEGRP